MERFKRKIDAYLLEWKESKYKMPLVVSGARQIGKTNAIRNFGTQNYKYFIEINVKIILTIKKIITTIFSVIILPIETILKLVKKLLFKPIHFITINIKKIHFNNQKNIKNSLKLQKNKN